MEWQQRGIAWPVKVVLFAVVGLLGFFGDATNGWGEPVAMALVAIAIPVSLLQFRKFWSQSRFWITVSLLAAIQVPLVVAVRSMRGLAKPLYMLEFVIGDVMFVGVVILLVCSKSSGEGN